MQLDQSFLEYAVKTIVDRPEAVETTRVIDQMGVLLTLTVHADDMGKIIGKSGKTAEALRILLRIVGMKENARVNLKINEPAGGKREAEFAKAPSDKAEFKSVDEAVDRIDA